MGGLGQGSADPWALEDAVRELAKALRRQRLGALVRRYPGPDDGVELARGPVALVALLPVAVVVAWQFDAAPNAAAVVGGAFAVVVIGLFASLLWGEVAFPWGDQPKLLPRLLDEAVPIFLLAIPIFWLGAAIWQVLASGGLAVLASHGWIVVAVGARAVISFDAETVAKGAALLFPIAILLVVLLTLTNEFWEVAIELSLFEMGALALILVGPVVTVLSLRLRTLVSERSGSDGVDPDDPISRAELVASLGPDTVGEETFGVILRAARGPRAGAVVDEVMAAAERPLRWIVLRRLLAVILTVALALFAYLYAVAVIAVPREVAADWSNSAVTHFDLPLLGSALPGAPYVGVCALLAIIATAMFVAFLIIEEESSATVVNALLEEPREHARVLGTPYALLAPPARAAHEPLSDEEFLALFDEEKG